MKKMWMVVFIFVCKKYMDDDLHFLDKEDVNDSVIFTGIKDNGK